MNIIIRKGKESDFEQIHHLFNEFSIFQKMPEKMTNTVDLMVQEKDFFNCFVAVNKIENQIIGYASYFYAYYTWIGKSMYIDDIFVMEQYRKQGIGKKLIEEVFELARKENCKKVRWQVSNWNKNAINFYKSLGAIVDNTELNCDFHIHY
jgi:diamine N-acetyltransferase